MTEDLPARLIALRDHLETIVKESIVAFDGRFICSACRMFSFDRANLHAALCPIGKLDGLIAAWPQDKIDESRSPDGDGLPIAKGLGDGASLHSTPNGLPADRPAYRVAGNIRAERSLKPADGSEPSDSLHALHRFGINERDWLLQDDPDGPYVLLSEVRGLITALRQAPRSEQEQDDQSRGDGPSLVGGSDLPQRATEVIR